MRMRMLLLHMRAESQQAAFEGDEFYSKGLRAVLLIVPLLVTVSGRKAKGMEKLSVDQVCYQLNVSGIDKASIEVIRGKSFCFKTRARLNLIL